MSSLRKFKSRNLNKIFIPLTSKETPTSMDSSESGENRRGAKENKQKILLIFEKTNRP